MEASNLCEACATPVKVKCNTCQKEWCVMRDWATQLRQVCDWNNVEKCTECKEDETRPWHDLTVKNCWLPRSFAEVEVKLRDGTISRGYSYDDFTGFWWRRCWVLRKDECESKPLKKRPVAWRPLK